MTKIVIKVAGGSMEAELLQTPTADAIYNALPVKASANVWGDEIYFDIPLQLELEEDACEEVAVGDLAYWPAGPAFCIFFGPTPVSCDETPRAYSPVNVFGRVEGDAAVFKSVADGATIQIEKVG